MKPAWIMSAAGAFLSMSMLAQAWAAPEGSAELFTNVPVGEAVVSRIAGISVDDRAKQHLGTIREVAYVGPAVRAYVLEAAGHLVAVAPSALQFNYDAARSNWNATLGATPDQIKAAPEFTLPSSMQ